jgi:hypothetical protein
MAGTAVVGAGNYSLEIDTGFIQDAFLLDDAVAGVLDNTQYVLDGTTNFADVTTGIDSITVRRGRRDQGDQFSAGTMVLQYAGHQRAFLIRLISSHHILTLPQRNPA